MLVKAGLIAIGHLDLARLDGVFVHMQMTLIPRLGLTLISSLAGHHNQGEERMIGLAQEQGKRVSYHGNLFRLIAHHND
jgi:hypothetical protein